jgi:TetR/AcrR family transcriptional repressor of lmrAB and yxaGH operons
MIRSSGVLLQQGGLAAAGIPAVLRHSGAPRGSVYHHFPHGRDQLVAESMQWAGERVTGIFDRLTAELPAGEAIEALCGFFADRMERGAWANGCPVATVVLETEPGAPLMQIPRELYQQWTDAIVGALTRAGAEQDLARPLAMTILAAIEGALVMSRAAATREPLDAISRHLRAAVDAATAHM